MDIRLIYITTKDKKEAEEIGRSLLEERLAACVNIVDHMESLYWWQGKLQKNHEAILLAKTTGEKVEALIARVKALHSYDCPCIVSLPIESGNDAFLKWVRERCP